jgi:hypothetical protein
MLFVQVQTANRVEGEGSLLEQLTPTPNVVVQRVTFPRRIREVPGSNFGPETGYPDVYFVVFLSPST